MENPTPDTSSEGHATPPVDPQVSPAAPLAEINSVNLFNGAREILIRHNDEIYRLRLTKNNRLILHK